MSAHGDIGVGVWSEVQQASPYLHLSEGLTEFLGKLLRVERVKVSVKFQLLTVALLRALYS